MKRIVLCSGKVFYDVEAGREDAGNPADVAVVRLEQFYPFPGEEVKSIIARYPNAAEIVWTQEEPQNMGGWNFAKGRLYEALADEYTIRRVSRFESGSPATGSGAIHAQEQARLLHNAVVRDED